MYYHKVNAEIHNLYLYLYWLARSVTGVRQDAMSLSGINVFITGLNTG